MIEKWLRESIQKYQGSRSFDVSVFNDPMAAKINWTPLRRGGANFRTHVLKQTSDVLLEIKPSTGAMLFYLLFIGIGLLFFPGLQLYNVATGTPLFDMPWIVAILFGLIFGGAGGLLLYSGTIPVRFDFQKNILFTGRNFPLFKKTDSSVKKIDFHEFHALQILSEVCSGDDSSYYSYELNLILKDTSRIPLLDHGVVTAIRQDAQKLSSFLKIPVWDSTTGR